MEYLDAQDRRLRNLTRATAIWAVSMAGVGVAWSSGTPIGSFLAEQPVGLGRPAGVAMVAIFVFGSVALLRRRRRAMACSAMALAALPGAFGLPIALVGGLIGGGRIEDPAGMAVQVVSLGGAALAVATGVAVSRAGKGDCVRCGGGHRLCPGAGWSWPAASASSIRIRFLVLVCACAVLPWGVTKQAWMWGFGWFGVDGRVLTGDGGGMGWLARGVQSLGVDFTVAAAAVAAVLMSAGVHRWFSRLLGWLGDTLGGRRGDAVRRLGRVLVVTCSVIASTLALYGVPLLGVAVLMFMGVVEPWAGPDTLPPRAQAPMVLFGGLAFTGIGLGLTVSGWDFARRTAPECAGVPAPREGQSVRSRWSTAHLSPQ